MTLELRIIKGKDFAAKDLNGKSDPYVVIVVNKKKEKTKVIYENLNPEWNETFFFDIDRDQCRISLTVWDKDFIGKDFMGEVIVPYLDILSSFNQPVEKWYALQKNKHNQKVKGEILIKMSYRDKPDENFDSVKAKQLTNDVLGKTNTVNESSSIQLPDPAPLNDNTQQTTSQGAPPPPPLPTGVKDKIAYSPHPIKNLNDSMNTPPKDPPPPPPSEINQVEQENTYSSSPINNSNDTVSISPMKSPPPLPLTPHIERVIVDYDFKAESEDYLSCVFGEVLEVLERNGEWIRLKNSGDKEGWVPTNYVTEI